MVWEKEIVFVTGASRGIGAAIADELGKLGATVIGTATSEAGAEKISTRFQAAGIKGEGSRLDVNDRGAVNQLAADIASRYGVVSVLVNNAGITRDNLMMRMKDEEWEDIISTNLTSVFHVTKSFLKGMMKARHGRIINISSVVGVAGNPGQANYAAAKAGIIGFSKSLAREIASRNITVNVIAPGFIASDMTDALSEEQKAALLTSVPVGRLGETDEIAHAVAFLASPQASYITGQTLHVNGGMYMN
ncbi:MAG: 3-oxoacyl-ACP reductase FabG [Gammaproteobacteria bacterium]|nr:3-oxoacyl-ACP reductase FabG [Gammaproteobacteria bacterium]